MGKEIVVEFSADERTRLLAACRALRTSYRDFVHFATMQAIDEMEGIAEQARQINEHYGR